MIGDAEWSDEYRPLLMQVYFKKPEGVKAIYSRPMVDLAMELHIHPKTLYHELFLLRRSDKPSVMRVWKRYAERPQQLRHDVKLLREMDGFGTSGAFFNGVAITLSFERMFMPVAADTPLMPVMLIMILCLYFRLTPITMVEETPEIAVLARQMCVKERDIVEAMMIFQTFDPYLKRSKAAPTPLAAACADVWNRFGNDPEALSATAAQMIDYWK
jgi:hypothetical protein